MIGSRHRMPKRARYPLFLIGLAIILLGGLAEGARGAPESVLAGTVVVGFAFLVASVVLK